MEFRSCPACKASVLEDDVEDCPFCGASMSGKPTAAAPRKPAPAPSTGGPRPGPKPASGSPAGGSPNKPGTPGTPPSGGRPSAPAGRTAAGNSDSADPFEVDTTAMRRAVKLAPRPTKTRTLEVKCPMCETTGYMLPTDAGKDVQCCNPDCMVPVFKTARAKVEEAPTEAPKDQRMLVLGGGAAAAVVIGALVWYFVLNPQQQEVVIDTPEVPSGPSLRDLNLVPEENKVVQNVGAQAQSPEQIRRKSLDDIVARARQKDRNRNADYGTQLAAEAFAQSGDLIRAHEQVRRLQSSAPQVTYLQIQPYTEIGWNQLASGNANDAKQSVSNAVAKAKNPPKSIRKSLDSVTSLAALCVAVGNTQEAQDLIDRERDRPLQAELTMLWRSAIDSRSFRIDVEERRPWHVATPEPIRVAVIEALMGRGQVDRALAFVSTGENIASQNVCLASWAGRLTEIDPGKAIDRVTAALQQVQAGADAQCLAWSAVAAAAYQKQNATLGATALEKATAAAGMMNLPATPKVPTLKEIHASEGKPFAGLPDPAPAQSTALAFSSLAIAQLHAGQKDASWTNIQKAVEAARGMALSAAVTQNLLDECETQESAIRNQLNQALNLGGSVTRLHAEFGRYRRQCGRLHAEAQKRLDLQVALLRFAATEGFTQQVWDFASKQNQASDLPGREPYLATSLTSLVLAIATANNNEELVSGIKSAFPDKPATVDPVDDVDARASAAVAAKDFSLAGNILRKAYYDKIEKRNPERIDRVALKICSAVQAQTTPEQMVPFIKNLQDVVLQEEAFLLLAGYTMQTGTASKLWNVISNSRDLEALDYVGLYRGFAAGYQTAAASTPAK